MKAVLIQASRLATGKGPLLVRGAAGTGKTALARHIHRLRYGHDRSFRVIDCAAIPETLAEGELFGVKAGAYSDATRDRAGLVEVGDEGTLFFHHIEELPLAVQPKLLRFLDTGEYRPLGGSETLRSQAFVIASAGLDLDRRVRQGVFRRELYYRLSVFTLRMPSLAERLQDIPGLIEVFRHIHPPLGPLPASLLGQVLSHPWPGNVRQLENWVQRCAALGEWECLDDRASTELESPDTQVLPLKRAMEEFKWRYITTVLQLSGGNRSRAARLLGLNRTHLIRILKQITRREAGSVEPEGSDRIQTWQEE